MIGLLLRALLAAGAFMAAAYLLPGFHVGSVGEAGFNVESFGDAAKAGILLGILNMVVRPVLGLLALPITLLTLGLFSLVLNGLMVVLTDALLAGVHADNFLWAMAAAIVISVVNTVGSRFLP